MFFFALCFIIPLAASKLAGNLPNFVCKMSSASHRRRKSGGGGGRGGGNNSPNNPATVSSNFSAKQCKVSRGGGQHTLWSPPQ